MIVRNTALAALVAVICTLGTGCPTTDKGASLLEFEALRAQNYTRAIRTDPADVEDPNVQELRRQAFDTIAHSDQFYQASLDAWEALEEDASEENARLGIILYEAAEEYSRGADGRERMVQAYATVEMQRVRRNRYLDRIQSNRELIDLLEALDRLYNDTADCMAELHGYSMGGEIQVRAENALSQARGRRRDAENINADDFARTQFNEGSRLFEQAEQSFGREDFEAAFDAAMNAANQFSASITSSTSEFEGVRDRLLESSRNQSLVDMVTSEFDSSHLDARGLVLVLSDLFSDRRSDIRNEKTYLLDSLVDILRENRRIDIIVEGHTSDSGSREANYDISAQRADAIISHLTSRDISRSRIESASLGEDYPRYDNRDRDGRADNNRVEIVFLLE